MAKINFDNVSIKAMAACIPASKVYNSDLIALMGKEEVDKMIQSVGITERRIADNKTCASDLCYEAAIKLMKDNDIEPSSIDMLLFMSQGSDFRIPATSCILQNRLGLSKNCAAMDLSLGCSGYVYGLSCAMAYASMPGINRVLLLDGETFSKIVNPRDKVNVPLYGDGGTATLIEKSEGKNNTFILHTDGAGEDAVKITAGMRNPITTESCVVKEREDGNFRSDLEVYMDGMEVFNFAIRVVPKGIKEILNETGHDLSEMDWIVFHQSNKFMTDFFVKKLKADTTKIPYCIGYLGNTSSASIPLTIVSELRDKTNNAHNVILCGFGAGLSWATAIVDLSECSISEMIEI